MARVTSKLQVTIPKVVADSYSISPGDELDWLPAGDSIRVRPAVEATSTDDPARRLELFDAATERQRLREGGAPAREPGAHGDRGWSRDDLYERGRSG